MRNLILLLMCVFVCSCGKKYTIEFRDKDNLVSEKEEFKAYDDETAFLVAYRKFLTTKKVEKEMVQKGIYKEVKTENYRLLNNKNEDITNMTFDSQEEKMKEEEIKISKIGEVINIEKDKSKTNENVDSAKIKELMPYFKTEVDEFDVNHRKWITPNTAAKYANANSIYFYFSTTGDKVGNLRLKVQYYADDWLFIRKYIFNIDGFPIEFVPKEVKRDNDYGKIWEWSDDAMTPFESSLINSIRYCKAIKVKFVGDDYEKVRALSNKEIQSMKRAIELYYAMGGSI